MILVFFRPRSLAKKNTNVVRRDFTRTHWRAALLAASPTSRSPCTPREVHMALTQDDDDDNDDEDDVARVQTILSEELPRKCRRWSEGEGKINAMYSRQINTVRDGETISCDRCDAATCDSCDSCDSSRGTLATPRGTNVTKVKRYRYWRSILQFLYSTCLDDDQRRSESA